MYISPTLLPIVDSIIFLQFNWVERKHLFIKINYFCIFFNFYQSINQLKKIPQGCCASRPHRFKMSDPLCYPHRYKMGDPICRQVQGHFVVSLGRPLCVISVQQTSVGVKAVGIYIWVVRCTVMAERVCGSAITQDSLASQVLTCLQ